MIQFPLYYVVDYWDVLGIHRIYRTNCRSLYIDVISSASVKRYCVHRGFVEDGMFYPQRLVARSATYMGV